MSKTDFPLIEIRDLIHRFADGTEALKGINLELYQTDFTVLGGENGSGKTVLMKHLNGILQPTSGDVLFNGVSIKKDPWPARSRLGFIFQNSDTQFVAQTVRDDIAFGPENLGLDDNEIKQRVNSAAESMEISDLLDHSPHRLSGGEKKKVAIAGILAMNPELIIFDEPFAGLDFHGVKMVLRKMLEVHENGTGVIVITHDLEKVLAHADRFIIIKDGLVTADGQPAELLAKAAESGMRVPEGIAVNRMSWLK